jgi:hypothetical protein
MGGACTTKQVNECKAYACFMQSVRTSSLLLNSHTHFRSSLGAASKRHLINHTHLSPTQVSALSCLKKPPLYVVERHTPSKSICLLPLYNLWVGLARTVYIRIYTPYIWWFPSQKYRMYTVYIWFWPTLSMRHPGKRNTNIKKIISRKQLTAISRRKRHTIQ